MADWTDLPMDILVVIAESLTVIEDFTSFSAVCKEWQSATAILKKKPSLPTRYPRIMLSEKVDTMDQRNQDDPSGRRCLGAHYGWLFTVGFDLQINLLHPFSRQQICLPPFLTFPAQRYEYDETYMPQEDIESFVKKIAISSNPQSKNNLHDYNHECVILAIYGEFGVLAFARLGDTLWTNIQVPSCCYDDVLYHKGRFYAVDCHGVVVVCDINDNNDPKAIVVAPAPSETHDQIQKYLVESSGDLLLVSRIRGGTLFEGDDDDNKKALYYTIDFSILRLEEYHEEGNNYAYKLTKVNTLEDRALFLGNNVSTSLPSSECIKANCIYFTDDNHELFCIGEPGGGGRDTGIFDIENGIIQSNYAGESRSCLSPPLWSNTDVDQRDDAQDDGTQFGGGDDGTFTSQASSHYDTAENGSKVDNLANEVEALLISDRTCTGVLCSHPLSRDIRIESLSLTFHGHDLIVDSELELNYGRRYGLLGLNGCGKSTLLSSIGCRELPIPEHMDIFHLTREIEASDMSSLEAVISCDEERLRLEREVEALAAQDDGGGEQLDRIYERLDALDASTAEKRAAEILYGLGFNKKMQEKKTRDFSGGWRMRIALARALFMNPTILLLDEPTNHLDLEACVWLEETLKNFDRILVVVSHSQDFLNGVCTNIIHMQNKALKIYTGNFDQYIQTRSELEENQMKQYKWEQEQIAGMKEYIARFGHGSAKLARQAQSKEKTLAKMERGGLTERVVRDKVLVFRFVDVGKLPPPVLQFVEVTFGYTPDNLIYKNLDFGVDLDSRVALVGPNGAGKSTLLKLMTGDLVPLDGMVRRHNHLRIAQFHQHLTEKLDLEMSALLFMIREYPGNEEEKMRAAVGRFGLTGKAQVMPMKNLSDGQRSRVIFAWLAWRQPHMLLLDEPTNHLDIETIDSLADALNEWDGGLVLVSHDFRLINQVAKEIWVCENQAVTRWEGDIMKFKEHLKAKSVNFPPKS
ncbi:ABC transporter family protein [Forsythia ovata]|uniref:ABC transporter family protein n=1 Tax=Forsythia ovata TaxID=205694 RepID=A0ABD1X648_9LAMI